MDDIFQYLKLTLRIPAAESLNSKSIDELKLLDVEVGKILKHLSKSQEKYEMDVANGKNPREILPQCFSDGWLEYTHRIDVTFKAKLAER